MRHPKGAFDPLKALAMRKNTRRIIQVEDGVD